LIILYYNVSLNLQTPLAIKTHLLDTPFRRLLIRCNCCLSRPRSIFGGWWAYCACRKLSVKRTFASTCWSVAQKDAWIRRDNYFEVAGRLQPQTIRFNHLFFENFVNKMLKFSPNWRRWAIWGEFWWNHKRYPIKKLNSRGYLRKAWRQFNSIWHTLESIRDGS